MHFAEELTGRYRETARYPAIAISDVSHLSCVSNDFGYEYVFSRYVEAVGREGDVLLGISTSGTRQHHRAIDAARAKGMKVITLTGKDGARWRVPPMWKFACRTRLRRPHSGNPHQSDSHLDSADRKEMVKADSLRGSCGSP